MVRAKPETCDLAALRLVADDDLIERVRSGELDLFEIVMRRYNRRIYKIARAFVRSDVDAEDVMQETYLRAFASLEQFAGRSSFSTWLIRIAINEALRRRRQNQKVTLKSDFEELGDLAGLRGSPNALPEEGVLRAELRGRIDAAIESLPMPHRVVFVMRSVEGLSTRRTARLLRVSEDVVKTRLSRARSHLRKQLEPYTRISSADVFWFHLVRCNRVVSAVLRQLREVRQSG